MSIEKKGYLWNTAAGIINAAEAVVMLMIVTRYSTIENAGVLTLAFAVGNLLMTIGKFGIKNFQVTDQNGEFSFSTYFWVRILSIAIMLVAGVGYLIYGKLLIGYSIDKIVSIFCIILIYAFESYEDLFWGRYQQCGRLDIGAKIFSIRWLVTLMTFVFIQILSKNFLLAIVVSSIISIGIGCCLILLSRKAFDCSVEWNSMKSPNKLMKEAFPLFIMAFLMFYITNAAKYSIDRYLGDREQACYGFIFMPVFVIELLNNFLYQPTLVSMSKDWALSDLDAFCGRLKKQLMIIGGLTLGVLIGGYLLGIPVLSLLYNTDLAIYKKEFMVLLMGGGMLAIQGYFSVILTIVRKQKIVSLVFIFASIVTVLFINWIVKGYQIMGASLYYFGIMTFISVVLGGYIIRLLVMEKKIHRK